MRILADIHISPRTVELLCLLGHDVVRVGEALEPTASDDESVAEALRDRRVVLTQGLDFTAIVAFSGLNGPSVVSLRLSSSRIQRVNDRLTEVLPVIEEDVTHGAIVTVDDSRIRTRKLPIE